jgi:hypothetical protein
MKMTIQEFKDSLKKENPPIGISEIATALWYDAKGDWEAAHNVAQSQEGVREYDLLHAYLHRREGDDWNANYWYKRAKSKMPIVSLEEEWEELVLYFL